MNLGERMKELRKERKVRQEDIAVELDIALMTYYRYEQGKREPTASVLCRMADYYGVSVDYLLGRSDNRQLR